jgi:hypothetical protein
LTASAFIEKNAVIQKTPAGIMGIVALLACGPAHALCDHAERRSAALAGMANSALVETYNARHGRPGIEPPTPQTCLDRILKMRAADHDDAAERESPRCIGAIRASSSRQTRRD